MTASRPPDVFKDVLNLEETYYQEGYNLGVADGSKSGRIEGRIFGLEKGFEKFLEMGRLNGKAAVWEARLLSTSTSPSDEAEDGVKDGMPRLASTERLKKHVERMAALSDADGLSTENSEDAVSEFDDRLKDAKAKATLITRLVGEDEASLEGGAEGGAEGSGRKVLRVRGRNAGAGTGVAGRSTGEMEDFVGLPRKD